MRAISEPGSTTERVQGPVSRPFLFISGILLLILLGFFLRLYRIDWQSLWVDENFTVFLSSQDVASITRITSGDVHPPLYYYLVHYWIALTGQSEFSLRFMSLFFSLLLVPLTFKTASLLMNRNIGLLAASLMAIAPFQVYYGQEARMYSLL
ncbi:MAG: glycosyltransferase family 39 protein, partial [Dehalococcoidia bacterium]|nr:glycosyltransferase family 39 protein [Dehalococcoidia bacterium]